MGSNWLLPVFLNIQPMKNQFWILAIFIALVGCNKSANEKPFAGLKLPSNFPKPAYSLEDNPVTKEGFELGRKLFYDPILSKNNTIACGSCHNQGSAFTHHGHDISHGINDLLGRRNALPVQNLLWQSSYFWDGGVHNLDLISLNPIQNPVEMDENPVNVIAKLNAHSEYPKLFKKAFGSETITNARFLQAMSQFMAMLISANSRYDQFKQGKINLTENELEGYAVFQAKCASCHKGELFSDFSFRNNGLSDNFTYDKGRYEISLIDSDVGKFKVPSLRNIAKTSPYMHTGSFNTLQSVLDHYASGVKYSPTLDPLLQIGGKLGISLTETEKSQIIDFLKTLTDDDFIHNSEFSEQ